MIKAWSNSHGFSHFHRLWLREEFMHMFKVLIGLSSNLLGVFLWGSPGLIKFRLRSAELPTFPGLWFFLQFPHMPGIHNAYIAIHPLMQYYIATCNINMLSGKIYIRLQHFDFIHIMRFLMILRSNRKKNAISITRVFLKLTFIWSIQWVVISQTNKLNNMCDISSVCHKLRCIGTTHFILHKQFQININMVHGTLIAQICLDEIYEYVFSVFKSEFAVVVFEKSFPVADRPCI